MTVNKDSLQDLMFRVDKLVDNLLVTIEHQSKEIDKLQEQNTELKSQYSKILIEIEQHISELEQIKKSLCQ